MSVVLYKTPDDEVKKCINSINNSFDTKVFIYDNSPTNCLNKKLSNYKNVEYKHLPKNIGFGAAHNFALKKSLLLKTKYHLILNPDVYFDKNVLNNLIKYMDNNSDVGLIMPKVLFPNGQIQYTCKLLPNPAVMLIRLFKLTSLHTFFSSINSNYELRSSGYNTVLNAPYLSGCFMLVRTEVLIKCGLFDERFFLHAEDIDFSRRIAMSYKTIFYPDEKIYHNFKPIYKKSPKVFVLHLINVIKYFNKWGWFADSNRKKLNNISRITLK